MKATITITDTLTKGLISKSVFNEEIQAQEIFDNRVNDGGWSEHENRYQMDLIAHHKTAGDLVRRSMYAQS